MSKKLTIDILAAIRKNILDEWVKRHKDFWHPEFDKLHARLKEYKPGKPKGKL